MLSASVTGEDGIERRVILVNCNRTGCTYARGPNGTHRVFVSEGSWQELNDTQKDALCRLVWAATDGVFLLMDPVTEETVALHKVPPAHLAW